jgi:hypothetical protein
MAPLSQELEPPAITGRFNLQDVNGARGGPEDIRCLIEVRPERMNPISVENKDINVEAATRGAAKKLRSILKTEFGKLGRR